MRYLMKESTKFCVKVWILFASQLIHFPDTERQYHKNKLKILLT